MGWQLEQCRNLPSGCRWEAIQRFDAATQSALIDDLQEHQSQCWRVQAQGGPGAGVVSNTVCR